MHIEADQNGYLYIRKPNGETRYILVDVPDSWYYGLLKLGEPVDKEGNQQCMTN